MNADFEGAFLLRLLRGRSTIRMILQQGSGKSVFAEELVLVNLPPLNCRAFERASLDHRILKTVVSSVLVAPSNILKLDNLLTKAGIFGATAPEICFDFFSLLEAISGVPVAAGQSGSPFAQGSVRSPQLGGTARSSGA